MKRILVVTLPAFLMSCERTTVREYEAPKELLAQNASVHEHVHSRDNSSPTLTVELKAPVTWQRQPPAPTRKASFLVLGEDGAKVDISVSSFPGESGGLLPNINRWREQLGLAAIGPEQLESIIERQTLAGREFVIVDLLNDHLGRDGKQRIVGAIVAASNETWFFKMTGDEALTAAQKPAFLEVLKSTQFGSE